MLLLNIKKKKRIEGIGIGKEDRIAVAVARVSREKEGEIRGEIHCCFNGLSAVFPLTMSSLFLAACRARLPDLVSSSSSSSQIPL